MMRANLWLGLSAGLLIAACSADKPATGLTGGAFGGGSAAGGSPAGGSAGAGAPGGGTLGGSPAGGSDGSLGGTGGGIAAAGGTSAGGGVAGVLPPTSTDYVKDATGESGLDRATIDTLRAGGSGCSIKPIYPYEGTVFPGGLVSPPIMWNGGADAVYVRMQYERVTHLDFQFAAGRSNPGELRIPQAYWNEITRRTQRTPLLVTLTVKSGGTLSTCQTRWTIAQGNMVGSIYYNTYNHPEAGGVGAILRLTLGGAAAQRYLREPLGAPPSGPCLSCHSVAASGSVLGASTHIYLPPWSYTAQSYTLGDQPNPPPRADIKDATFGALTPDGSAILRMGNPDCTHGANGFPRSKNNFPLLLGPMQATLIDTASGQPIAASGLTAENYMWMPQFSPDGRQVVFNHARADGSGGTERRELAIMDYNPSTHAFSNLRPLVTRQDLATHAVVSPSLNYEPLLLLEAEAATIGGLFAVPGLDGCVNVVPAGVGAIPGGSCTGPCYPAWPFFTPDGSGVIFSMISEPDFTVAFPGRDRAAKSELWYVDVLSRKMFKLEKANTGLAPGDSLANYYPTVLPVQVGGYFWVFWTATRDFGHHALTPPAEAFINDAFGSSSATEAFRKRIWVSAIRAGGVSELGSSIDADPSFPGFYLEGQSETGNTRAFATLNPCKPSGNECTSGLDCCTGFCSVQPGAASGTCVEKVECAKTNERCGNGVACCPPSTPSEPMNSCIGGYCGFLILN
jgi:hypothetical protein